MDIVEVSTPTKLAKPKEGEKESSVPWRESVTNAVTAHYSD